MKVTFTKNITIHDGKKVRMFRAGKVYDLEGALAKRLAGLYTPVKSQQGDIQKVPPTGVSKQDRGGG